MFVVLRLTANSERNVAATQTQSDYYHITAISAESTHSGVFGVCQHVATIISQPFQLRTLTRVCLVCACLWLQSFHCHFSWRHSPVCVWCVPACRSTDCTHFLIFAPETSSHLGTDLSLLHNRLATASLSSPAGLTVTTYLLLRVTVPRCSTWWNILPSEVPFIARRSGPKIFLIQNNVPVLLPSWRDCTEVPERI